MVCSILEFPFTLQMVNFLKVIIYEHEELLSMYTFQYGLLYLKQFLIQFNLFLTGKTGNIGFCQIIYSKYHIKK